MIIKLFLLCNPFFFTIPKVDSETSVGLAKLQESMQDACIPEKIDSLLFLEQKKLHLSDAEMVSIRNRFLSRLCRGTEQVLDSPLRDCGLIRINRGGKRCIVTTLDASYRRNPQLIQQLVVNLRKIGFNGSVYYRIGGIANPHKNETPFISIPYSFKIFAMEEAYLLGFTSVLWLDARLMPLKSLDPIFSILEEHHGFFIDDRPMLRVNFLSFALDTLLEILEVNPLQHPRVITPVFGLDFSYPATFFLLHDYYRCCENGFCFLSIFPEEHVLGSLLAKYQKRFKLLTQTGSSLKQRLWLYDTTAQIQDTKGALREAEKKGFFFFGLSDTSQFNLPLLFPENID